MKKKLPLLTEAASFLKDNNEVCVLASLAVLFHKRVSSRDQNYFNLKSFDLFLHLV